MDEEEKIEGIEESAKQTAETETAAPGIQEPGPSPAAEETAAETTEAPETQESRQEEPADGEAPLSKEARKEEKARQKQLAKEEKQQKKDMRRTNRALVRQERWQEVKVMIHTAQLVMLLAFILLAIDQVGIYGFLFVWLFIAVMAAAIALLLLGLIRKVRGKRSGIIFAVAICIVLCAAWFIFLFSTYGFGQGPVPN